MDLPPLPRRREAPDYPEKQNRMKKDTGEWSIEDLVHETKNRARTRLYWLLVGVAAVITAIGGASAAVIKAWGEHENDDQQEARIQQLEGRLWDCCKKGAP